MKCILAIMLSLAGSVAAKPPVLETKAEVEAEVSRLWVDGNYAALDEIARDFGRRNPLTKSGYGLADVFRQALVMQTYLDSASKADWDNLESKANSWLEQDPASASAHLVWANVQIAHAWAIRGQDYSHTVAPWQWAGFHEYLEVARNHLVRHQWIRSEDPAWYERMLKIATWQGWSEAHYRALLDSAQKQFPDYLTLYFAGMDHYAPKWGGSAVSTEAYARKAVSKRGGREGDAIYALMYNYAFKAYFNEVDESRADCTRWSRGIDYFAAKFPTPHNQNVAALTATRCRNLPLAQKYFPLIGDLPHPGVWGATEEALTTFRSAQEWSKSSR